MNKISQPTEEKKNSPGNLLAFENSLLIISASLSCLPERKTLLCQLIGEPQTEPFPLERTVSNNTCSRFQVLKLFPIDVNRDSC